MLVKNLRGWGSLSGLLVFDFDYSFLDVAVLVLRIADAYAGEDLSRFERGIKSLVGSV